MRALAFILSKVSGVRLQLDKIHADSTRNSAIGKGVSYVTPIIGKATTDVMVHSSTWPQHSELPPSGQAVKPVI